MVEDRLRIRRARLEDLAKVSRLEKSVWKEMAASKEVIRRRFFLFPQGFKVARIGLEIAGFCSAVRFDVDALNVEVDESFPPRHVPRGGYYFLFGLTVNPIYRRRGIASALVAREIEESKKQACVKIQVIANASSRRLFEKQGFEVAAGLQHLFQDYPKLMPDAVLMERTVEPRRGRAGE